MNYVFKTVNEAWCILQDDFGDSTGTHNLSNFYQSFPRGRKCNESICISISILEPKNCLVWTNVRSLSPIYLANEYAWYQNGSRKVEDAPSKVWQKLANKTGPDKGLINSNYGAYIFTQPDINMPGLSVWERTKQLIQNDNDTRQAIIQIPIMPHRGDIDTPCNDSIHFILRNGKLNATIASRSADMWFGAPNDWTQFILWQMMMAKELDVELGWFKCNIGSLHLYEENFITDKEEYFKKINEEYIKGKEDISYFKYYDERDYKIILNELLEDFKILSNNNINKEDKLKELKNEELIYMLTNMKINTFIN